MKKKSIFIAATGQHVGKTTICLGLIAAMKKKFKKVGFIKPVGQQHVEVEKQLKVDKDAYLFKKYFDLKLPWEKMSPIIFPRGYTRDYLDGKINDKKNYDKILRSFKTIAKKSDYTIVEGTGHVGVGTIANINNAKVCKTLGIDMVIISSGGLGSSFDELSLNFTMCKDYGVNIRGVILNRVIESKREMILHYFPKALKKWNIPILGCIPFSPFLSTPTMMDFEQLFDTELLSAKKYKHRHFKNIRLVSGSVGVYHGEMIPNQLVITPTSRDDIIHATLERHHQHFEEEGVDFEGGMILTGKHPPSDTILNEIEIAEIPVLYAPVESYDAMKAITGLIAKTRVEDIPKIEKTIELVENNINLEMFL